MKITGAHPTATQNARPFLQGPEFGAICDALHRGQYGHGETTERFERDLARFLGVRDVVAVSSCTTALQVALHTAGIGPGDEVIVPSLTFCATVQAILACGAHPRFVEVCQDTLCVRSTDILDALTPGTRAVLPVLYGGRAVDLRDIQNILDDHDITVIEDAAHAFGSRLGASRVGATGALTCFSFGPIKNLTCVEGGAVVPRTASEAETARRLRALGIHQAQAERIRTTTYTVGGFGLRATMSSVHAAVGSAQLEHFDKAEIRRKDLWRTYAAATAGLDNVVLVDVDLDRTVPFNCVVRIPYRDQVFAALRDLDIGVGVHYPPNHLQPAFAPWYRSLPVTEALAGEIMSLPFHPHLDTHDVRYVVAALDQALAIARTSTSSHQPRWLTDLPGRMAPGHGSLSRFE